MEKVKGVKITNGKIITPGKIIEGGSIVIRGERISAVNDKDEYREDCIEIDAKGNFVSPGFIDIHVHGGGGYDFMDATEEAFLKIATTHVRYGTTTMLPTTLTGSKEQIIDVLATYAKACAGNINGSQFLGMHLEGPYLAMSQKGAQDPQFIRDPDPTEYREITNYSGLIKRWSAAPELKGSIEFGQFIKSKGILPSMAHTDAIYEKAEEAFRNGYTLATHFYSAMSGVTRKNAFRYAGVIEAGYLIEGMDVEIIADGVHLPAPLLKLIYKIKGPDHIALVTDAMRAAGTSVTESVLGNKDKGLKVIVEDGVAKLPDRSSFAGSVATSDKLVRTMLKMGEVCLVDVIKMAAATPARILGVDNRKGTLEKGKDADIVIFDEGVNISLSMVKGRVVYKAGN